MTRAALKPAIPVGWVRPGVVVALLIAVCVASGVGVLRVAPTPVRDRAELEQRLRAALVLQREAAALLSTPMAAASLVTAVQLPRLPAVEPRRPQPAAAPKPTPMPRVRVSVRALSPSASALDRVRVRWARGDREAAITLARGAALHLQDDGLARAVVAMSRRAGVPVPVSSALVAKPVAGATAPTAALP
ncbi:MAG: hypothetical protein AAGA11_11890 [Pseudomonadota bacterium]